MLAHRTCKIIAVVTLLMGFGKLTNAQEIIIGATPWTTVEPGLFGRSGCFQGQQIQSNCANGRCSSPGARPSTPVRRPAVSPRRQAPATGNVHPATVMTCSKLDGVTKRGRATAVDYNGKYYLVSCAHIWGGTGFKHYVIIDGNEVEVEMLGVAQLDDLAILRPLSGMYVMNLNLETPAANSSLNLGYRPGTYLGHHGVDIVAQGCVKEGDSGGPIYNAKGLVGIIASYEYATGTDPLAGQTSGPCSTRIANFISSLLESPSLPTPPADPPEEPVYEAKFECNLDPILGRLTELEKLPLQIQTLNGIIAANSREIDLLRTHTIDLESRVSANALETQSIGGVVEALNKEVIAVSNLTLELEEAQRASVLRIQQLENTTATLRTNITANRENLQGKIQFRLRVDQSGRVIGVDPR